MVKYAPAYAIALILMLILDALWLGIVARSVYVPRIGGIMLEQPRWGVAAVFYLLYPVGLTYFAIAGGWQQASWQAAALNGAVFGFMCYLTYNATNLSIIRGYDGLIAVLDTAWGTVVSAVVAGATVAILKALGRTP
jgi:uncharacterized membrane protein